MVQQFEIKFNAFSYALIGKSISNALSICFIGNFLSDVREIVLVIGILDMGQEFCPFSCKMHASTKQITG